MNRLETVADIEELQRAEQAAQRQAWLGNFETAHEMLGDVLLASDPPPSEPEARVGWVALQATAWRNHGFLRLRQHLQAGTFTDEVADAVHDDITRASFVTHPYLLNPDDNVPPLTGSQDRRLSAVHGETLGHIGRLLGVTQVIKSRLEPGLPASPNIHHGYRQEFEAANHYLMLGDSAIAGARNAMLAARMETANGGETDEVRRWVRQAKIHAAGSYAPAEPRDQVLAPLVVLQHYPSLLSRRVALHAATYWRTV